MKFPAVLLGIALVCCLGIAGYIHNKRKHEIHLNKQASFLDIKFRVTRDVLGEYQEQLTQSTSLMEKTKKDVDDLSKELSDTKTLLENKKRELETCNTDKKRRTLEGNVAKSEKTSVQSEFIKEKVRWSDEVGFLKKTLEGRSKLCKYIDMLSNEARSLCGIVGEPPKPEAPKAEQPKPEAPKAEQPKPEAPKAEQPKPEAPKAEQPKPEAPKAEQPKPEAPKAEQPQPEAPKAEQPKPEAPKAEQPQPEAPKAEQPQPKAPKAEQPQPEAPKAEQPKPEEPQVVGA